MLVFQKIWRVLFSCNTRFEIRPFALCRRSRLRPPSINYLCLYVSIRTNPFILQPHCSDALKDTKKLWQL